MSWAPCINREFKQQRGWRLRICAASNLIALIPSRLICQMFANVFWNWILKEYQSSEKEKESCYLVFLSSTKREIRHFHLVVVRRRQGNVQKSVKHVQSCCFANLRVRSIGKSGFRFWKSGFRICNRTRNPKTDFNAEISVFGFSFLPLDWKIRKRIWKTVLKNSGLARARILRKKKTTVHETSFANPFSDFPIER